MNSGRMKSVCSSLRIWIEKRASLFKFGIVGVMATACHFATANSAFFIFNFLQGEKRELFSNIIGYISGFFISYFGNKYWSFLEQARHVQHSRSLPRFLLTWIMGFGVNQGVFYFSSGIWDRSFNLSITCGVIVAAVFTYLCNKYFVFK